MIRRYHRTDAGQHHCIWTDGAILSNRRNHQHDCQRIHGNALVPTQNARAIVGDFGKIQTAQHRYRRNERRDGQLQWRHANQQGSRSRSAQESCSHERNAAYECQQGQQGEKELERFVGHRVERTDGVLAGEWEIPVERGTMER